MYRVFRRTTCRAFNHSMASLFATAMLLIASSPAVKAAEKWWTVAEGDWSIGANWGGTVPLSFDDASIGNGGTVNITQLSGRCLCNDLYVGKSGDGYVALSDGGSLWARWEYVGATGIGNLTQTGGENLCNDRIYIGSEQGSDGSYDLSGGRFSAPKQFIGGLGNATFRQSGGTNTSNLFYLGYTTGGSGSYFLSGGELSGGVQYVGHSGKGTFQQSGGDNHCTDLYLGYNTTGRGDYTLSGDSTLSANQLYVGYSGTGTFVQSDGNTTVNGALYLGFNNYSQGIYTLSGTGTLTVGSGIWIGNSNAVCRLAWFGGDVTTPKINLRSTGVLAMGFDFNVGELLSGSLFHGTGTTGFSSGRLELTNSAVATHAGGSVADIGWLSIGTDTGSGSYHLVDAGQLSSKSQYIGDSTTGTFTQAGGTNTVTNWLVVGHYADSFGTYALSGNGQLIAAEEHIGDSGTGSFAHAAGTNSASLELYVGYNAGSTGAYDLSGTGQLTARYESIGHSGTGTFTQTGGSNSVSANLYLGNTVGSNGTYRLGGTGQFYAPSQWIGLSGTGTFIHSAGMNHASNFFALGINSTGFGTYELSGTAELSAEHEYLGWSGKGAFVQSGGANLLSGYLLLGSSAGASGTYDLSAGNLSSLCEYIGESGTGNFNQSGGLNSVSDTLFLGAYAGASGSYNLSGNGRLSANVEYIGKASAGAFLQTGGVNTIADSLYVSYGGAGSYELAAGQFSAKTEYIGGAFTHSGGTNSASDSISIGYNSGGIGTYNLTGTGVLETKTEYIGNLGIGAFAQSGGTNSATFLQVGSKGSFVLSAGTVNVNGGFENTGVLDLSNNSAVLNASSSLVRFAGTVLPGMATGTVNLDEHSLLIVPSGFDPAACFANYSNAGLLHHAGQTLTIPSASSISGIGSIDDHVVCEGSLFARSTYFLNLNAGLFVSDTGSIDLGTGTLFVNNLISGMNGGTIKAASFSVGSSTAGKFQQSGGTSSISTSVTLGSHAGALGTFELSGTAQLTAPIEYVGASGTGVFIHSGGENLVLDSLLVGGTNGSYQLSGTGQLTAAVEYVGRDGTGVFVQSGGVNSISGSLYLGFGVGNGTYMHSGTGTLTVGPGGEIRLGADGGGYGRLEWFGGSLATPSMTIGSRGTLAMGFDFPIESLIAGDLFQGTTLTQSPAATLEITNGATASQSGGSPVTLKYLSLGTSTGVGTYRFDAPGQLTSTNQYVGNSNIGVFQHSSGTNTLTGSLYLGNSSGGNGSYQLSGAAKLIALNEYVGNSGTGVFDQTGGSNAVSAALRVLGTYNLSGAGQLNALNEEVNGFGVFNQTGGSNAVSGTIYLGYSGSTGGNASYTLSGGTLAAETQYVGFNKNGSFLNSGGSHTVNKNLYLGNTSGSTGVYRLSGSGTLTAKAGAAIRVGISSGIGRMEWFSNGLTTPSIVLGSNGTLALGFNFDVGSLLNGSLFHGTTLNGLSSGALEITNSAVATHTAGAVSPAKLYLGSSTGTGTYNLSGSGNLSPQNAYIGYNGAGTLNQTGGTFSTSTAYVGYNSTGMFYQTGGTGSINTLYLGYNGASNGTYSFSAPGQLSLRDGLYVGFNGMGTLNHSSGTLNPVNLLTLGKNAGSSGAYNLNSSGILYTYNLTVGDRGAGDFYQTGGIHSAYYLTLAAQPGSRGGYYLTGGTLVVNSGLTRGGGSAAFDFGGGTLTTVYGFSSSLPMTLTGLNGNANVDTANLGIVLSGVLSGSGGLNKLGKGLLTLSGPANSYSGPTTVTGGTLEIAGGIGSGGTSLIDVQAGVAVLRNTSIVKSDLFIHTSAAAKFQVKSGSYTIGGISGNGTTQVDAGATLTAVSVQQETLIIGSVAAGGERMPNDANALSHAVPEPSALALLLTATLGSLLLWRRHRSF